MATSGMWWKNAFFFPLKKKHLWIIILCLYLEKREREKTTIRL